MWARNSKGRLAKVQTTWEGEEEQTGLGCTGFDRGSSAEEVVEVEERGRQGAVCVSGAGAGAAPQTGSALHAGAGGCSVSVEGESAGASARGRRGGRHSAALVPGLIDSRIVDRPATTKGAQSLSHPIDHDGHESVHLPRV